MKRSTKHSRRKTSKLALCINTGLCWGVAFYSLYTGQGSAVVGSCLALIGALYGSYVGVGHLDYRRLLHCINPTSTIEENEDTDPEIHHTNSSRDADLRPHYGALSGQDGSGKT